MYRAFILYRLLALFDFSTCFSYAIITHIHTTTHIIYVRMYYDLRYILSTDSDSKKVSNGSYFFAINDNASSFANEIPTRKLYCNITVILVEYYISVCMCMVLLATQTFLYVFTVFWSCYKTFLIHFIIL